VGSKIVQLRENSCHSWSQLSSERDNVVYWKTKRKIKDDLQWAAITAKSVHGVACTSMRRLGHPARALDWVPGIIFVFFLFISATILPPSREGFLFTMFPHREPCVRGPPRRNIWQILRGGSYYTGFLMREHSKWETPPGGRVSFDQSAPQICPILDHNHAHRVMFLFFP